MKCTVNSLTLLALLSAALTASPTYAETVTVRLLANRDVAEVRVEAAGWEMVDAAGRAAPAADCLVHLTGPERSAACGSVVLRRPPYRLRHSLLNQPPMDPPTRNDAVLVYDGQRRRYPGVLEFVPEDDELRPQVTLDLDLYVAVVLAGETAQDHPEYLKAMAVTIRTYATERLAAGAGPLSDTTAEQVFSGLPEGPRAALLEQVARDTAGRILRIDGRPAPVLYHACCGGRTRPAAEIRPILGDPPHLRGVADIRPDGRAWCEKSRWFAWEQTIPWKQWTAFLQDAYQAEHALREDEEGPIRIAGRTGERRLVPWPFRVELCRAFEWSTAPSDRFEIIEETDRVILRGRGLGHRVGLCQAGALAQAEAGRSAEEILRFYFPGLSF